MSDTGIMYGLGVEPNRPSIASVSAVQEHNIRLPERDAIAQYG
jgi:hypothetical protein